jgi:hypothetical protein
MKKVMLGASNPHPTLGDLAHKWILAHDPGIGWTAKHLPIQAPPVDVGPVTVNVRRGVHPHHLAVALRALADYVDRLPTAELDDLLWT